MELQKQKINDNFLVTAITKESRINALDDKSVRNSIIDTIALIIWESGFNVSKEEQRILINYMINEIKTNFHVLTLTEIKYALQRGVRGYYGDVMGINVRMMHKWIYSYMNETRLEMMKKINSTPKIEKTISEEDKNEIREKWIESCLSLYDRYTKDKSCQILDFNGIFYNYLKSLNIVKLTKQEVDSIWKSSIQQYKTQNKKDRGWIKNIIKSVNVSSDDIDKSKEIYEVRIIAKNKALYLIFDKIQESGIDLREIIKNKKN